MKKYERLLVYSANVLLILVNVCMYFIFSAVVSDYKDLMADYTTLASRVEVLEQSAMPEAIFEEPKQEDPPNDVIEIEPRYGFTDAEVYLLTQLLCGSAGIYGDGEYDIDWWLDTGKEPNEVEVWKVLGVVMNRIKSSQFPDTIEKVLYAPKQFTAMLKNGEKTVNPKSLAYIRVQLERYDAFDETIPTPPANHLYFEMGPNITNITKTTWR